MFCIHNKNIPWITDKLRERFRAKEAYTSGNKILYHQARNALTKEIRAAKRFYTEKQRGKNGFS